MRRKTIFLTLVAIGVLFATGILPVTAGPPLWPHQPFYWVATNGDTTKQTSWYEIDYNEFLGGNYNPPFEPGPFIQEFIEVWYTDWGPGGEGTGPIRPISEEGWNIHTDLYLWVEEDGTDATLCVYIEGSGNKYPEQINWTIENGYQEGAKFRIKCGEITDSQAEPLCDVYLYPPWPSVKPNAHYVSLGNVDDFKMELFWYEGV